MSSFIRLASLSVAAFCLSLGLSARAGEPVRLILDSDIYCDYDDVGAFAVAHAYADEGKCEIIACGSCTRHNCSVAAIEILNRWYGRPDIPVGALKEICSETVRGHRKYTELVSKYPGWYRYRSCEDAPDAVEVYRKALAAQPDGSVVLCTVGFMSNVRRLLESKGDAFSPLDGTALVARKCRAWYAMACRWPKGHECNSRYDGVSSKIAFEKCPVPIVFLDWNYGTKVESGAKLANDPTAQGPVADLFRATLNEKERAGKGHKSWDQLTVIAAVEGWEKDFACERGTYVMTDLSDPRNGVDEWRADPKSRNLRLVEKTPFAAMGEKVDELMCRRPKNPADLPKSPYDPKFKLFLLVGQSNMAGRGKVSAEDKVPDPRLFSFGKKDGWVLGLEPVHFDKPKVAGAGLSTSFARAYLKDHPDCTVGLIPCAVGGTPISRWTPGKDLYEEAVRRAKLAQAYGEIVGILWHQGEADCGEKARTVYADRLKQVVNGFRKDLSLPDVPFVAGGLAPFCGRKDLPADAPEPEGPKTIRRVTRETMEALPHAAYAPSEGCDTHIGDSVHFDTPSLRKLGLNYYEAYRRLVP